MVYIRRCMSNDIRLGYVYRLGLGSCLSCWPEVISDLWAQSVTATTLRGI